MRVRYGMIHGRFQPFHNGHLEYGLQAAARCDQLIIGITNPDPSLTVQERDDPERHLPAANIFTFFERQWMIRSTLIEAGVDLGRTSFVPFPIHHPECWQFYCPLETTQFVRIFSRWGEEKTRRFRERGWAVEVLDKGTAKQVSGREVREKLLAGQGWEELVPRAVACILHEIGAIERVRKG
jgi:nicotinamide-nucleotide adenylyltransferase